RKKQAALGIDIADAALHQADSETTYNVTRMYFTVLYARAQYRLTGEVVETFQGYHDIVSKAVLGKDKGDRTWTTETIGKLTVYLRLAESRRAEAQQGIQRALAALREAMGVEPCYP